MVKIGAIYRLRNTGNLFLVKGVGRLVEEETAMVVYSPTEDPKKQLATPVNQFNGTFVFEQYPY